MKVPRDIQMPSCARFTKVNVGVGGQVFAAGRPGRIDTAIG